jgi:LuxR family maltose regulon positive regulatory protein
MNPSLLTTKFYIPPPRDRAVARAELCRRLGEGLLREGGFSRSLTLVSAPPGFGKTSLVSEWLSSLELGTAWLSLDEKDNDAARFLGYLVAALQTAEPGLAGWVLDALQVAQPPSMETLLVRLVNDLAAPGPRLVLVLDDYHVITAPEVDAILAFLVDRLPVRVHLVLATREDPALPLARYRARGQMVELRARDLVFSTREVREFFHGVMKLDLGDTDIAALEARTEGWAAGLQFAALALQNGQGPAFRSGFIASFTGSHRFVLDYLAEEVLLQQSGAVQTFLLASACLGRFCGELCDAVLDLPAGDSWEILARLDRANLFLVPLDAEGRWFRYHHLFAGLLQQRLAGARPAGCPAPALIHARASRWFDAGGLILEAFRHAAASGDMPRAEALIEDRRMPTHTRDAMMEVLAWLLALPAALKDSQPSLWV